jgi:hypothetical protein
MTRLPSAVQLADCSDDCYPQETGDLPVFGKLRKDDQKSLQTGDSYTLGKEE